MITLKMWRRRKYEEEEREDDDDDDDDDSNNDNRKHSCYVTLTMYLEQNSLRYHPVEF